MLKGGKIVLRGRNETSLFADVNAPPCATKVARSAHSHFDKYKCLAVSHDEIDLTEPAAVVTRHSLQLPRMKKLFSEPLRGITRRLGRQCLIPGGVSWGTTTTQRVWRPSVDRRAFRVSAVLAKTGCHRV